MIEQSNHLKEIQIQFFERKQFIFANKIYFSDEALFTLGGYVNKQNCRIWGSENTRVIAERPLHPEKVASRKSALFGPKVDLTSSKTTMEDCHRQFGAL